MNKNELYPLVSQELWKFSREGKIGESNYPYVERIITIIAGEIFDDIDKIACSVDRFEVADWGICNEDWEPLRKRWEK